MSTTAVVSLRLSKNIFCVAESGGIDASLLFDWLDDLACPVAYSPQRLMLFYVTHLTMSTKLGLASFYESYGFNGRDESVYGLVFFFNVRHS